MILEGGRGILFDALNGDVLQREYDMKMLNNTKRNANASKMNNREEKWTRYG